MKTTEKKKETTGADTEKKEDKTDKADEVTTEAADKATTAAESNDKDDTDAVKEEGTTKEDDKKPSKDSDKKNTEEAKDENKDDAEKTKAPTELTYQDEDVIVTVSEVNEGAIPEGAELKVVPILKNDTETQAQYTEVEKKIQEKAAETETDIKGFLAYDITFVDEDGNEIEPNSEVKVSMEYKEAAIPAELTAEEAQNAEVSVMHLEEDDAGNVSKVVDMSEAGKVDTLETTDAKQVEKVEMKTESFSSFVITWGSGYRKCTVTAEYVYINDNGEEIPFPENIISSTNVNLQYDGQILELSQYKKEPTGEYENYLCTKIVVRDNNNEETEITELKASASDGFISTNYDIQYRKKDKNDFSKWLSTGVLSRLPSEGKIYFVYEEVDQSDLKIKDNIIENGSLDAEYTGGATPVEYKWYKSGSKDGEYKLVEKVNYQGGASNLSEDGMALYPAYDEGAREWYKVEVIFEDGTKTKSKPYQVPYYDEVQNGSFETPQYNTTMSQVTNEAYKNDLGVWQSTGEGKNVNIEILREGEWVQGDRWDPTPGWGLSKYYAWQEGQEPHAADGKQFAELNCEATGALYQDVLTIPDSTLNYSFYHRARGTDSGEEEYDTMFLVIMPTKDSQNLTTQEQLEGAVRKLIGDKLDDYDHEQECKDIVYNENGILIMRVTSDDQDWNYVNEIAKYTPTTSMTRFFFMAGSTAAWDQGHETDGVKDGKTIGNFLDDVWFSQKLPDVSEGQFSLEIRKRFDCLGDEQIQKVRDKIQFTITAKDSKGVELSPEEVTNLFGRNVIQGKDMISEPDGSLWYPIANKSIDVSKSYTVTVTESNAELDGYTLTSTAKYTLGEGAETEGSTFSLTNKTMAKVTFTNSYALSENKTVNFTKVWDDGTYGGTTRPDSLNVTLKPTISVYKDNKLETIELTSDDLDGIDLSKTITGNKTDQTWTTSWDVPVYYDGEKANGVKVKIDYTVEEGEINSDYVYEADSEKALTGDGSEYTSKFNPNKDEITLAQSASSQKSSKAAVAAMAAAASTKAAKDADSTARDDLGEPAHNKYIEYNENTNDYTLNLDVTGAKGEAKGVDVLFVIDTSGSMAGGLFSDGLLDETQDLLTNDNGIIDQIFKADGNVNSVAYVSFAGKSETKVSGWYNKNNSDALKDSIDRLRATGGTNWTYAMQRASDVLDQRANNDNEKVVIFLSDGEPTYTMSGNRQTGSGSSTRDSYYNDAANVVKSSSSLSKAKIYSVYLTSGTASGMDKFANLLRQGGVDAESKNGTNLDTALNEILDIIIPTYTNVTITDTLSEYVDFVDKEITVTKRAADGTKTKLEDNYYTVNISKKTVTVILKDDNEEGALDDGATYTVSFKVKPNETAENYYANWNGYPDEGDPGTGATSAGQKGFYSNDGATVTYTVNDTTDTASYPDPVVQVTTHDLTIEKKWNQPSGTEQPTDSVELRVTFTDGTSKDITLTQDENYKYVLKNVPVTRKISTVEEISKFNNYEPSYQYSADGTTATVINNYSKLTTQNIVVNKEWEGNGPKSDVQIVLYRSVNGGDAEQYKTATLTEANWSVSWNSLTLTEVDTETGKNNQYSYAVREVNIPAGYNSSISYQYDESSSTTTATITNTYDSNCADEYYYIANVLQTEKLNVSKTWEDNDNAAGLRPKSVIATIKDGEGGQYSVTLSNNNSWHETLTVLKKKNRTYSATETMQGDNVDNYTMGNSGNAIVNGTNISFTNTLMSTSITVKKKWNDNNVTDRPTGIEFKLEYSADGGKTWEPYGEGETWEDDGNELIAGTYILLKENLIYDNNGNVTEWARTFTNLPIQYQYRVKEVNVPGEYHSKVTSKTGNGDTTFTITNTLNWSLKKTNSPEEGETAVALQGATFELKQKNILIATGTSGEDGVVDWAPEKISDGKDATYDLQNLDGDYVLIETKAPTGYQGLTTITWKLHFDNGALTSAASYKEDDPLVNGNDGDPYITLTSSSESGAVITVQNDLLYELPETGGPGIYWYTLSGTLLMAGAALIVYRQKRKREVLLRK